MGTGIVRTIGISSRAVQDRIDEARLHTMRRFVCLKRKLAATGEPARPGESHLKLGDIVARPCGLREDRFQPLRRGCGG